MAGGHVLFGGVEMPAMADFFIVMAAAAGLPGRKRPVRTGQNRCPVRIVEGNQVDRLGKISIAGIADHGGVLLRRHRQGAKSGEDHGQGGDPGYSIPFH